MEETSRGNPSRHQRQTSGGRRILGHFAAGNVHAAAATTITTTSDVRI
jgi:hypothetical protein